MRKAIILVIIIMITLTGCTLYKDQKYVGDSNHGFNIKYYSGDLAEVDDSVNASYIVVTYEIKNDERLNYVLTNNIDSSLDKFKNKLTDKGTIGKGDHKLIEYNITNAHLSKGVYGFSILLDYKYSSDTEWHEAEVVSFLIKDGDSRVYLSDSSHGAIPSAKAICESGEGQLIDGKCYCGVNKIWSNKINKCVENDIIIASREGPNYCISVTNKDQCCIEKNEAILGGEWIWSDKDNSCIFYPDNLNEGICFKSGQGVSYQNTRCCDGLIRRQSMVKTSNGCDIDSTKSSTVCMPCGNGKCESDYGENSCVCPEDCGSIKTQINTFEECDDNGGICVGKGSTNNLQLITGIPVIGVCSDSFDCIIIPDNDCRFSNNYNCKCYDNLEKVVIPGGYDCVEDMMLS